MHTSPLFVLLFSWHFPFSFFQVLEREYPVHEILDLAHILGLDDLVLLFMTIREFSFFSRGEMGDQSFLGTWFAAIFFCDLFVGRPVFFLVDAVTLEAVVLARQCLGGVDIDGG